MNQAQLNRARALRQTGFTLKEISRLVGVPYKEVHNQLTGKMALPPVVAPAKPMTVEDHGKVLLSKKPSWFKGSDARWRYQVEMVFGVIKT